MVITCPNDTFNYEEEYKEYFNYFNFELSNFQKWSIKAIVDGHHSLILLIQDQEKLNLLNLLYSILLKKIKKLSMHHH